MTHPGGSTSGLLTDGVLRVAGNFTSWSSGGENFAATGNHRTILDGTAAQTIDTYFNGAGQSRFWDLEIQNVAGVAMVRNLRVSNDFDIAASFTVNAGLTATVSGTFTLQVAGTLNNSGTVTAAACSLLGTVNGTAPICP
ncbi:MAG: hypothetical protein O2956_06310 [Gemmatimonadetes bacterium]|nr:hypothetical protein [Gemmatimonadota bacterium]